MKLLEMIIDIISIIVIIEFVLVFQICMRVESART